MSTYLSYDGLSTLVNNIKDEDTKASEKVKDASSSAKAYLLGHESQNSTSSAVSNSSVYMENGELNASTLKGVEHIFHSSENSSTKVFATDGSLFDVNPTVVLTLTSNEFSDITAEQATILYQHNIVNFAMSDNPDYIFAGVRGAIDDAIIEDLVSKGYTNANDKNVFVYSYRATSKTDGCDEIMRILFMLDEKKFCLYNITLDSIQITDMDDDSAPYYIIGHRTSDSSSLLNYAAIDSSLYMQNGELYSGGKKVLTSHEYRPVKVNGTEKLVIDSSAALDVSAGDNVSLSYTNNKLVISATDTDTTHDVSITGDVTAPSIAISDSAVAFNTTIKDGAVTLEKLADAVKNGEVESGETNLVTGGTVYNAIQNQVGAAVKYLGTVSTSAELIAKTTAGYGDFARATAEFNLNDSSVHVGDMIILDSSAASAYSTAANWSVVHGENDTWREIKVNGTTKIATNNAQALDVSAGSNTTLSYTNNKLVINSTDQKTTESGHYTPSTKANDYGSDSADYGSEIITGFTTDSKKHITGAYTDNLPIPGTIGGENLLRNTRFMDLVDSKDYSNKQYEIYCSWDFGKFVNYSRTNKRYNLVDHQITILDNSPLFNANERVGGIILNHNAAGYGIMQSVQTCENIHYQYIMKEFYKFRSKFVDSKEKYTALEINEIPVTISFYCKAQNSHGVVVCHPFVFNNIDLIYEDIQQEVGTDWKKISYTEIYKLSDFESEKLIGIGYIDLADNSDDDVIIACPTVSFGDYDIDWKPNTLDKINDINGIGNICRYSKTFAQIGTPNYNDCAYRGLNGNFTTFNDSVIADNIEVAIPGCESLNSVNAIVIHGESAYFNGICCQYESNVFSQYFKTIALCDETSHDNYMIPVSMSIWCYCESNACIKLMPMYTKDTLYASEENISRNTEPSKWTRLTRTIYIKYDDLTNSNINFGGILVKPDSDGKVKFALPMVTFGSTPSTWFPSAYDILSGIDSAASSASSAQQDATYAINVASNAQSLANTSSSTANTALTTANNKVSKSGDTMSGNLDMSGNCIYDANVIETDILQTYTNNAINFNCGVDVAAYGFMNGEDISYTSSQLMQGDGIARDITTTLTNSTNIPTSSAVLGLKVGGRNLLRGTKDMTVTNTNSYWYRSTFRTSGTGTQSTVTYSDGQLPIPGVTKTIKLTCASGSSQFGIAQNKYKQTGTTSSLTDNVFNIGDTLCLSYWVKPSAAGVVCTLQPIWDCGKESTDGVGDKTITLSAGWQRVYYSGTLTSTSTLATGFDIGYIYCKTQGASIEVCCPKLEFGQVPTDWTPALEDVGNTTDIIDTTGTYTYTNSDGSVTVRDITMCGRLNLLSTKSRTAVGGVIQFGDGATYRNYIGEGTTDQDGNFIPDDSDVLVIGGDVTFVGNEGSDPVILLGPADSTYMAQLRNMDKYATSATTSFTWNPNKFTTNYGSANYQYMMGHTATTLTVTASSPSTYFNNNFQYLLIQQTSNTCTVTLTGTNIKTKGNITSFTVTAGQSIEFCALYVNGYTYVTYTIFS